VTVLLENVTGGGALPGGALGGRAGQRAAWLTLGGKWRGAKEFQRAKETAATRFSLGGSGKKTEKVENTWGGGVLGRGLRNGKKERGEDF